MTTKEPDGGSHVSTMEASCRILALSIFISFSLALCACGADRSPNVTTGPPQQDIVAGPNERTFTEQYNVHIRLPLPESEFLALLDRLNLRYRVDRERGLSAVIPKPRWRANFDLSNVRRMYVIHGNDAEGGVTEQYRAYVNENNQVIYIENTFVYPPIG